MASHITQLDIGGNVFFNDNLFIILIEMVTLDRDFMQSRAKDFQLPTHVQTTAKSNVATVMVEKSCVKHTEPTIRAHHKWRNSSTSHFCVHCWMRPKRRSQLRRKSRRKSLSKKRVNSKSIISSNQLTGDSFIDDVFSLIK